MGEIELGKTPFEYFLEDELHEIFSDEEKSNNFCEELFARYST